MHDTAEARARRRAAIHAALATVRESPVVRVAPDVYVLEASWLSLRVADLPEPSASSLRN